MCWWWRWCWWTITTTTTTTTGADGGEEGGVGVAITAGRWCQQTVCAVVLGAVNVWQHCTAVSGRAGCMWGWCLASGGWGVWPRCASTSLTTGAGGGGAGGGGGGREGGNGDWFGSVRLSLTHSPGLLGLPRQCMPGFLLSPKYIDNHSGKDQQPRC